MVISRGMKVTLWAIAGVVLLLLPFLLTNQYYLHVVIIMLLFSIVSLGMWLIYRTGQVSFAQAGFMAIGAYTVACLTKYLGFSFWIALPLAGVVAAVVAILVGIPTLKLRGSYFFLVTFAMGEAIRQIFNYLWIPVLGGPERNSPDSRSGPHLPPRPLHGGFRYYLCRQDHLVLPRTVCVRRHVPRHAADRHDPGGQDGRCAPRRRGSVGGHRHPDDGLSGVRVLHRVLLHRHRRRHLCGDAHANQPDQLHDDPVRRVPRVPHRRREPLRVGAGDRHDLSRVPRRSRGAVSVCWRSS